MIRLRMKILLREFAIITGISLLLLTIIHFANLYFAYSFFINALALRAYFPGSEYKLVIFIEGLLIIVFGCISALVKKERLKVGRHGYIVLRPGPGPTYISRVRSIMTLADFRILLVSLVTGFVLIALSF